jgi:hypothetical protein
VVVCGGDVVFCLVEVVSKQRSGVVGAAMQGWLPSGLQAGRNSR